MELNVTALKNILNHSNSYKIIDIRESWEIEEQGKIPMSIHIPMDELIESMEWQEPHMDYIILYCRSGRRSAATNTHLRKFYFTSNTYNLIGGNNAWQAEQNPDDSKPINLLR